MRLTKEQFQIANFESPGYYAVKGIAGSGKTSIGIQRIAYLLENRCVEPGDRILVLTFNRSLIRYLEYLYEKFSASFPKQLKLTGLDAGDPHEKVVINTLNDISYRCFEDHFPDVASRPQVLWGNREDRAIKAECFSRAVEATRMDYPNEKLLSGENRSFLENEINWLKACMYFTEYEYLQADRSKTGRNEEEVKLLPKQSRQRRAIFKLYENLRVEMKKINSCEFIDTEIAAINYARKNPVEKYTHIIVDESQDLTRLQFEFLKQLVEPKKHGTITFLYDTSQSIYPNSWLGMGKSFASAGFDVTGRTKILRNNYRTSNEILMAARNMISANGALTDGEPFYCNQSGVRPMHIRCTSREQQNEEILKLLNHLREKFELTDIAITSRYNRNLHEIKEFLDSHGIDSEVVNRSSQDYGKASVKLITFHSFKGIESQAVIIPDLVDGQFPYMPDNENLDDSWLTEERKLFYVAMTRASKMLFLFSYGFASPFVSGIAPELLREVPLAPPDDLPQLEEPGIEYQKEVDYRGILNDIEKSYGAFVQQRERLKDADQKFHPGNVMLTQLVDFVKENHLLEDIQENKSEEDILEIIRKEMVRKQEENRLLNEKIREILHSNREAISSRPKIRSYEEVYGHFQARYPGLGHDLLSNLAYTEFSIEVLPDKNIDFSSHFIALAKVVEVLLRRAIKEYALELRRDEQTLGKVFYLLIQELDDWNRVLHPLASMEFVKLRNNAAHSKRTDFGDLERLRQVLYEQNVLGEIIEMVA